MEKKITKIILSCVIIAVLIAGLVVLSSCASGGTDGKDGNSGKKPQSARIDRPVVEMTISDGTRDYVIEILLYKDIAPITVNNFMKYAENGFYEGTAFHRVIKGLIMQGGQFVCGENGYEGKENELAPIEGEFKNNKTTGKDYSYNVISHKTGVISMARSTENSATSGFFIMLGDNTSWDGDYAAFGQIIDSEDVSALQDMCNAATLTTKLSAFPNATPVNPITITKVEIKGT